MERGDIYAVQLNPTAGHEQQGYRPVLIISKGPFNQLTGTAYVAPITTGGNFAVKYGMAVPLVGLRTTGVVRCDQVRLLDISERSGKFVEQAPENLVDDVVARFNSIIL